MYVTYGHNDGGPWLELFACEQERNVRFAYVQMGKNAHIEPMTAFSMSEYQTCSGYAKNVTATLTMAGKCSGPRI
jgi:hypothetical protein